VRHRWEAWQRIAQKGTKLGDGHLPLFLRELDPGSDKTNIYIVYALQSRQDAGYAQSLESKELPRCEASASGSRSQITVTCQIFGSQSVVPARPSLFLYNVNYLCYIFPPRVAPHNASPRKTSFFRLICT
jgi:hypothetical protein